MQPHQFKCALIKASCCLLIAATSAQAQSVGYDRAAPLPAPPAAPSAKDLRQRLAGLEQQLAAGKAPSDAQNLALFRFKLEQAHLWLDQLDSDWSGYAYQAQRNSLAALQRAEAVSRAHGDAVYPTVSQLHERAYIAPADDSPQPYWVFLPKGYTPTRSYPLVVFLHGYDPNISKAEPWLPGSATWSLATNRGFIFVIPYGRRNSDFVDIGEDDTLAVLHEVQRLYTTDPSHTYLMGASMGGFGVYAVGLHHPDVWSALTPMSARSDFYLWFNLDPATVPGWKRVLYDANDPRHLKLNAMHLPILLQHGALDHIVNVENSRRFYADLKALNYAVRYRELPDSDHYIYWQSGTYEIALDWSHKVTRASAPRRVAYTTGDLRNHRAYWVDVEALQDYGHLGSIDAQVRAGNELLVQAENVGQFSLQPPAALVDVTKPIALVVNGVRDAKSYEANQPIRWRAAGVPLTPEVEFRGLKSAVRSGPIKNCFRDPFLLVFGTKTGAGATNPDEAAARRFADEWQRFADGTPPLKADAAVTDADRQRFNLVLFGTRQSNSVLGEIADRLPLELTATGFRAGEQQFRARDLGLRLCYPSPFDARRMVVVQSGQYYGDALPINHKFDLLPDYIVYTNRIDQSDGTNATVMAGFFDGNWALHDAPAPVLNPPGVRYAPDFGNGAFLNPLPEVPGAPGSSTQPGGASIPAPPGVSEPATTRRVPSPPG